MSSDCMDEETAQKFDEMMSIAHNEEGSEEIGDRFTALGKMLQVGANLSTCNFRVPIHDITTFCHGVTATEIESA